MTTRLFKTPLAIPVANTDIASHDLCPSDAPLVLFPIRLETRFFTLPGGQTELRIRVYPDKIHIDTHHLELTTDERTWGASYWQRAWLAGDDEAAAGDAWRTLANRFGAARAAWIARLLQPTNLAERPSTRVPDGQAPPHAPILPTLPPVGPGGENTWRQTPVARMLPDRWVVNLHSNGRVALSVTSRDIRKPLAVGPNPAPDAPALDPATDAAIRAGDRVALDQAMMWMVDFDEAEAAGMGIRMIVPQPIITAGIDSLVVMGVANSLTPAAASASLADLLDAHHYTDGLEFLPFGTASNNTDDRRAGYSSDDPDHARSFANEVQAPTAAPNAARLGAALGLPPERIAATLGHLGQARLDHDRDLRSMNTTLWPVAWGYFLSNMMGEEVGLTPGHVDWARQHFLDHVRGGGALPALRVGMQPYGVLPVSSLDLWAPNPAAPQEAKLKAILTNLRDGVWRGAVAMAPHVGMRPFGEGLPDPDQDLADVMSSDGVSHGYAVRGALGQNYVKHLRALNDEAFPTLEPAQASAAAWLMNLVGLPQSTPAPRLARAYFRNSAWPVKAALVQPGEAPLGAPLEPNYITELLGAPLADLIATRNAPAPTSLLQALLRHGLLREVAVAAARLVAAQTGANLATLLRDLELVDMIDGPVTAFQLNPPPPTLHWRRQLQQVRPDGNTVGQHLAELTSFSDPAVRALGEFRDSLAHLQNLSAESLELLMQSTLDLSAHRLDAWISSLANQRLATLTAGGHTGAYVGAYGWVENLRPAGDLVPIPAASLPAGEAGPLFTYENDSGFIHAPSATHAQAAALLRNAHLGPTSAPHSDDPFAIDLSSRRVREASRLLDGVRAGQPLGALLGYRLERRLHELGRDRCIVPLRNLAPLVARERNPTEGASEALAAANVIDGRVLLERWAISGDDLLLPIATEDRAVVTLELAALRRDLDGLTDALTAEVAYQMARGNTSRLASTLSAIAQGDAPPPELEVTQIPRTGSAITHRVAVGMNVTLATLAGWKDVNSSILASNERPLNAWVSRLLGDARKIRCTVERIDEATGDVAQTVTFPLSELELAQLDFIYGVDDDGGGTAPSHIEQLTLYHAQRRAGGFGAQTGLRLNHARPTNLAAGEQTLADALQQARAIRRMLESARALRPEDLGTPDRPGEGVVDLPELEARIVRGENALNVAHHSLQNNLGKAATLTADTIRTNIRALAPFGVRPAVPCVAVGDTLEIRETLLRQAAALLKTSGPQLERSTSLRLRPAAPDPRQRREQLLEYGRSVFGARFVLLPRFTCDAATANEVKTAMLASTQQQGGDPLAAHNWFTRSARVRGPVGRLGDCLRWAETITAGDRLSLTVAQLPFDATERWVGLPPLPGNELAPGKLSLVLQTPLALNPTSTMAGLLIDEWVEVAPSASETTAVTFQFNPPNAFAPQNVLIATPPVPGQAWTTETLRRVLVETLDLAKIRAVGPELLGPAAQYLPGVYIPFNAAGDAVSTDFNSLVQ